MIPSEAYLLAYVAVAIGVVGLGVLTVGPLLTVAIIGGMCIVGVVTLWVYWAWTERRMINAEY